MNNWLRFYGRSKLRDIHSISEIVWDLQLVVINTVISEVIMDLQ